MEMENPGSIMMRGPNKADDHNSFEKENVGEGAAQLNWEIELEMMVVPTATATVSYTSLRDIMPQYPTNNGSSWNEIPNNNNNIIIKNPLLKQAALAYLQPMSSPPDLSNKGFLHNLRENCFSSSACGAAATWLFTLLGGFVAFFCDSRRNPNEHQLDDGDEHDNGVD